MSARDPAPGRLAVRVAVVALLALHAALLVHTARSNGETYDEPFYLLAGRSYWEDADVSLNREHPPLLKWLIGAPLAWADMELPRHVHTDSATQRRFFAELNDPDRVLWLGRLPMLVVGLLLGLVVFAVGRRFGGDGAGLLAMGAYVSQPALLGHAPLAALDLGAAAFGFAALAALGPARRAGGPWALLLAGVALGLGLGTKFSNLVLLPVVAGLLGLDAWRERSARPLGKVLVIGAIALSTLVVLYGAELRPRASLDEHPRFAGADGAILGDERLAAVLDVFGDGLVPLPSLLEGVDAILGSSVDQGHPGFFRGEAGVGRNWPDYYLVTLAVKTPVGLLLLLLMALPLLPWLPRRTPREEGALLLFPLLVLLAFSTAKAQLGVRYVLPVCVLFAVLVGRLASLDLTRHRRLVARVVPVVLVVAPVALALAFPERGGWGTGVVLACALPAALAVWWWRVARTGSDLRRVWRVVLGAGVLGAALEVALVHPEHLVFSNAYAGGPERGWRIQCVGDDWGQGTPSLARAQREQGWPRLHYEPYSTGAPERFGLDARRWAGAPLLTPASNLVAVHAAVYTREPERMGLLEGLEPMAVVNGILVFEVPTERLVGARGL